jgi:hypothetical protein
MIKGEKTVAVGGVSHEDAVDHLRSPSNYALHSIPDAVPNFKKVSTRSFNAEWALIGKDIQVKFFLPKHARLNTPEARQAWMDYWLKRFTAKIDQVARRYFEAEHPRLVVKWTEEFQSWWFCAKGYDYLLDVAAFLSPFFDQLDRALQEKEGGTETPPESGGASPA